MVDTLKFTLRDGTRTSVPVDEVMDIEADGTGAVVRLISGQTFDVVQNARTLELRLLAAAGNGKPAPTPAPATT